MKKRAKSVADEEAHALALMQQLPDRVRVGAYDFHIRKWTANESAGEQKFGVCSTTEQMICVQMTMPTRYKAVDTTLHEIIHAVYWAYGIEDGDKEERVVSIMGSALCALHRDNPWLADWLKKADL